MGLKITQCRFNVKYNFISSDININTVPWNINSINKHTKFDDKLLKEVF